MSNDDEESNTGWTMLCTGTTSIYNASDQDILIGDLVEWRLHKGEVTYIGVPNPLWLPEIHYSFTLRVHEEISLWIRIARIRLNLPYEIVYVICTWIALDLNGRCRHLEACCACRWK